MADGLAFGVGLVGAEIARLSNEQAQRYPLIYRKHGAVLLPSGGR